MKTVKNFPNLLAYAEVAKRTIVLRRVGVLLLVLFMFLIPFYNTKLGNDEHFTIC